MEAFLEMPDRWHGTGFEGAEAFRDLFLLVIVAAALEKTRAGFFFAYFEEKYDWLDPAVELKSAVENRTFFRLAGNAIEDEVLAVVFDFVYQKARPHPNRQEWRKKFARMDDVHDFLSRIARALGKIAEALTGFNIDDLWAVLDRFELLDKELGLSSLS
jgi:hypothetical protein